MLMGNVVAPAGLRLAPFVILRSGQPYDVLVGEDLYGDTLTNARAALVSRTTCATVVRSSDAACSPYGTFTSNYRVTNLANLVPRNYLTMPGLVSVNLRLYRTFAFGHSKQAADQQQPGMPSPGVMGIAAVDVGPVVPAARVAAVLLPAAAVLAVAVRAAPWVWAAAPRSTLIA